MVALHASDAHRPDHTMHNWTIRTRITAAFATIIAILAALGVASWVQLAAIRSQADRLDQDVLPGLITSSQGASTARELLPDIILLAAAQDDESRQRARLATERALAALTEFETAYRPTITTDEDRRMFEAVVAGHGDITDRYNGAMADGVLSAVDLAAVRPVVERYGVALTTLMELNKRNGLAAARTIREKVSVSLWTLVPAITLATILALVCAWLLVQLMQRGLTALMDVTKVMSVGDFRQRVQIERRDELGLLGEGINQMADDLTGLIGQVQQSGIQVNSSATEIAATSKQQQATATEIAATTSEVGATASRISATSRELARTVEQVSEVASQTGTLAQSGQGSLRRMEASMKQISEASNLINSRLALLSEKAANIGMVVTTINKVADQTNLLSLNAAIEAEKAGEHGRGFAVVAREIRRLADQTAVATFDIEQLVKEMQSAVSAGVMGMDKFSEEVRRGGESVEQVTAQLSEIIDQVQTLTPSFDAVNEGVQSQSISAQQISDALAQLSVAAQQTADSLRQSNTAIDQLNDAARGLQSGVSRFTLAG